MQPSQLSQGFLAVESQPKLSRIPTGSVWLMNQQTLVNEPKKVLGHVSTVVAVRARLQQLEDDDAALSKSENSWRSCIFHGIRMDAGAVGFLVNTLAAALAL